MDIFAYILSPIKPAHRILRGGLALKDQFARHMAGGQCQMAASLAEETLPIAPAAIANARMSFLRIHTSFACGQKRNPHDG
jgi:hypothetical protein